MLSIVKKLLKIHMWSCMHASGGWQAANGEKEGEIAGIRVAGPELAFRQFSLPDNNIQLQENGQNRQKWGIRRAGSRWTRNLKFGLEQLGTDETHHKKFQVDSMFGRRIIKGRKSRVSVIFSSTSTTSTTTTSIKPFFVHNVQTKLQENNDLIFSDHVCVWLDRVLGCFRKKSYACMHACMYASRKPKELGLQFFVCK